MQMMNLARCHTMLHHWFSQRISDLRHRRPALPPKLPQGALFLNATIIVLGAVCRQCLAASAKHPAGPACRTDLLQ